MWWTLWAHNQEPHVSSLVCVEPIIIGSYIRKEVLTNYLLWTPLFTRGCILLLGLWVGHFEGRTYEPGTKVCVYVCVCSNERLGLLMFLWQLQTKACSGFYDNNGGFGKGGGVSVDMHVIVAWARNRCSWVILFVRVQQQGGLLQS